MRFISTSAVACFFGPPCNYVVGLPLKAITRSH